MDKNYIKPVWLALILLLISGCLSKDFMPTPTSGDYEGKVVDAATKIAIPHVEVTIGESKMMTDLNGEFIFSTMPPGDYQVSLKRSWYHEENYPSKHVGKDVQWYFELKPEAIDGGLIYSIHLDKVYQNELYYLNLRTRKAVKLLQTTHSETNPVFTNGSILYDSNVNQAETGYTDIYRYTPGKDTAPQQLFPNLPNSGHPSVSADGNKIVFQSRQNQVWYVMLQVGGSVPQTIDTGENPVIDPSGRQIAYIKNDALYIYDLETQTITKVNYFGKINHPSWCPKISSAGGWQLLVEAWPGAGGRHRIYLIRSDRPDQLQPITSSYGNNEAEDHHHPGWSSNGEIIFFTANILFKSREDIYCIRLDDALTSPQTAAWVLVSPGTGSKKNPAWVETGF